MAKGRDMMDNTRDIVAKWRDMVDKLENIVAKWKHIMDKQGERGNCGYVEISGG